MIEVNKTLKNYLKQLPFVGLLLTIVGIVLSYTLLKATYEIPLIYLPLLILSLLLGYVMVFHFDPGGNVNYYPGKHIKTKDEETLNNLIIKYRNKTLINITAIILTIIVIYYMIYNHRPDIVFNFDLIIGTLLLPGITFLCLGHGIKYITAWWNIRKNLKY